MEAERAKSNQMGLIACIAYVTGNIVGSGIFITPSSVLEAAGSIGMALFIWFFCGLISLLGAVAYIELGTAIPSDGGDFAYASYVGWHAIAFAFMVISALITYPASTAVQAVTFGDYMAQGVQQFLNLDEGSYVFLKYGLGVCLLIGCTVINLYSQNTCGGHFQVVVTLAKGLILAVAIVIGVIYWITGEAADNLAHPMKGTRYGAGGIVMALYGALWSYAGWDILNYGAPAVKNPRVALPISLIGGLSIVTTVYVLTNFAFAAVLGREDMLSSKAVAATFAERSMGSFAVLIPFAAAILLLGSVNANIFCSSRITLEAAREGHLFEFLSAVHKPSGSPRGAVIFQFLISFVFCFFEVETIINYVSFIIYGQKLVTMGALFYMRYKNVEVDTGVLRIPLIFSVLFALICSILVAVPFYTAPLMTTISILAMSTSFLLYIFFIKKKVRPQAYIALSGTLNSMLLRYLDSEVTQVEEPVEMSESVQEDEQDQLNKSQ